MNRERKIKIRKVMKVVMFCTIFAFAVLCNSSQALAAKDVTTKMKNDKGIKWITKNMTYYGAILYSRDEGTNNKKKNIKMSVTEKYSIAAILAANKYGKIDANKYKHSKYKSISIWMPKLNTSYTNILYKKLYGSNINYTKVKNKKGYILKKGNNCYVAGGQFGAETPKYAIKKITKQKKGVYLITANIKMKYDEGYPTSTVGKMWITVKKDKKAAYGYKVKKLSYSIK